MQQATPTTRAEPLLASHLVQQCKVEALDQVCVRHIAAQVLGVFIGHVAQVALLEVEQEGEELRQSRRS